MLCCHTLLSVYASCSSSIRYILHFYKLSNSGSETEEMLQTVAFQLFSLLLGVCLKWNTKHTKMSVDAGSGKLNSFQVAKGHQKVTKKHIKKIFF